MAASVPTSALGRLWTEPDRRPAVRHLEKNWRRIGHLISDAIYKAMTGEEGYFDSRIVYIAESGPKDKRQKVLTIMDQDGFNARELTDGTTWC